MLFSRCFHMKITTFLKKLIIHNAKKFNPNNQIRYSNLRPTMHLKEYHHMTSFNNILAYFFKHVFHFAYKNKCNGHFQFSAVCYKNWAHPDKKYNNIRGKGRLMKTIHTIKIWGPFLTILWKAHHISGFAYSYDVGYHYITMLWPKR